MQPAPLHPTIREIAFGRTDYAAATALRDRVLRQPLGLKFSEVDLAKEPAYRHFGLFSGSEILATVMLVPREDGWWQVRQMAVAPAHQGTGLGRTLLLAAEKAAHRDGVTQLYLHARQHAIGFYARLGYVEAGERFTEVGIEHARMEKRLR